MIDNFHHESHEKLMGDFIENRGVTRRINDYGLSLFYNHIV
jgi:hypothetical protein